MVDINSLELLQTHQIIIYCIVVFGLARVSWYGLLGLAFKVFPAPVGR